jgi:nicotinamide-nucleotide amidase
VTDGDRYAEAIASLAMRSGFRVGVAESLTCGKLSSELGATPNASEWFRGGVVAYASGVKFDVLGVTPGPVVTPSCAREMAAGAAKVLDADATVAVTGVGGPDPQEGEPPGTVYAAAWVRGVHTSRRLQLDGGPEEVLAQTAPRALELLLDAMRASAEGRRVGAD